MKKSICLLLCICSILLASTIIFTSCNKNVSDDPLQTESTTNETTADTTPSTTTPMETTPEETTPAECVHEWMDATCISPKTCTKCSATEGDVSKEHTFEKEYECSVCKKRFLTSIEEAIAIGMSYEKGKYSSEYYFVELTLDHQINADGFARAKIADGLYISVAGGYLTEAAYGSIHLGDTVVFKAKLGAVNSTLTTGGKELRLFAVAAYEISPRR